MAHPTNVERWILEHHPYWRGAHTQRAEGGGPGGTNQQSVPGSRHSAVVTFLLGLAYQLRLVQATKRESGDWLVRLSPLGRWLLGLGELPPRSGLYPQTLLTQPNLEIVAYRQGLNPGLIVRLSRFAAWKSLGAACTLQLQPETVYRAWSRVRPSISILQTLEQHSMARRRRQSWSPWQQGEAAGSAWVTRPEHYLEFNTPEDLNGP